jgi:hypothetical protein
MAWFWITAGIVGIIHETWLKDYDWGKRKRKRYAVQIRYRNVPVYEEAPTKKRKEYTVAATVNDIELFDLVDDG